MFEKICSQHSLIILLNIKLSLLFIFLQIQGLIDSRKYLKELSVATGLAAMDSLIQRVEKELLKPASPKNGKYNYATKVYYFRLLKLSKYDIFF